MREIKFRGKRIDNGEWVYGYLIEFWTPKGQKQKYAIDTCQTYAWEGDSIDVFEIIPETVGQYTGLKDKKGKEIYEGDIVKGRDIYKQVGEFFPEFIGKVEFGNASFKISHDNYIKHYRWLYYECEVIGNIYENPELVEREVRDIIEEVVARERL